MIVVSDSGPLNYLIWIDAVGVLPQLYETVVIPEAVQRELSHPKAPTQVRQWIASLPNWVSVQSPRVLLALSVDIGEQEAISLAVEIGADLILLDDRSGREAAEAQELSVTGTLGVLRQAARRGLIDLADTLNKLRQTNFRASPGLIVTLLIQFQDEQERREKG